jgi:SET domain-containing protein
MYFDKQQLSQKIININKTPLVYKKQNEKGTSLFAKKNIKKGTPLLIYYGDINDKNEIYKEYINDKENYIKNIGPYIRDINDNKVVNGIKYLDNENLKLCGVLVNDYCNIKNNDKNEMLKYIESKKNCNVEIIETNDFPIYYSIKKIKKDEEICAHYGIGYWLLHMGIDADKIKNIIDELYNTL